MRKTLDKKYESGRILIGRYGTKKNNGLMGAFYIVSPISKSPLLVISSGPDNQGWEHVSVSLPDKNRTPNWAEMCFVKNIFWDKDECVVQYHPPETEYVNNHPYTLHLWRPINQKIPVPPKIFV